MATKTNTKKPVLSTTEKAMKILAIAVEKAANKITDTAGSAVVEIHKAANVASDKIASDVSNAKKVIADDAATALKVSSTTTNIDHDLITKLGVGLETVVETIKELKLDLKADIKDIKDGTSVKIETNRLAIEELSRKMPGLITDVGELKTAVYTTMENRIRKVENKVYIYFITISLYTVVMTSMIGLIIWHILHTV